MAVTHGNIIQQHQTTNNAGVEYVIFTSSPTPVFPYHTWGRTVGIKEIDLWHVHNDTTNNTLSYSITVYSNGFTHFTTQQSGAIYICGL